MRLFELLLKKPRKENQINYKRTKLEKTINDTLNENKLNGCRMNLYLDKNHYMLELTTYIRSTWILNGGDSELSYSKLSAYVLINDGGAKLKGTTLDSNLNTEQTKSLLKDWNIYVKDFTTALDAKLAIINTPINEQVNDIIE